MIEKSADLTIRPNIDAELSQTQLDELAACLWGKRRELTKRIIELEREIVVKDNCSIADGADAASRQEGRIRAGGMVKQHRQTIKEIEAALHRLSNGKYGVDEITGEPIEYDRLQLVPWAKTNVGEKQ